MYQSRLQIFVSGSHEFNLLTFLICPFFYTEEIQFHETDYNAGQNQCQWLITFPDGSIFSIAAKMIFNTKPVLPEA
jgi:hypothetical protein